MPVNPSEAKLFEELAALQAANPDKPLSQQTLSEFRAGAAVCAEWTGEPAAVAYQDASVLARDGYAIPIRIYNPERAGSVFVYYPGCGYISDVFEINAIAASRITAYANMKVIAVNFRLAPEHPMPGPIYDSYDVLMHLFERAAQYQIDKNKVFIGGLSSGAHCAAAVSYLMKTNTSYKIARQILLNGSYDLIRSNHEFDAYEAEDKICTRVFVDYIYAQYGLKPIDYKNPLYSGVFTENANGLPPTTILVGEYDGLRNDSEHYYQVLQKAGVKVERVLLPGQTHSTLIFRGRFTDGEDPALTIAKILLRSE